MQRKQEQGSMQTQGEVQEIGIEEWLVDKFPLDSIEEIKKENEEQIVCKLLILVVGKIVELSITKAREQSYFNKVGLRNLKRI